MVYNPFIQYSHLSFAVSSVLTPIPLTFKFIIKFPIPALGIIGETGLVGTPLSTKLTI